MKPYNCYYIEYTDDWPNLYCDNHKDSADMYFGLLQVSYIKLGSPQRTFPILFNMTWYKCYVIVSIPC